jgi:dihydrofolate reductase
MGRVRVLCFGISIDGYGAGPNQDMENPMGMGGMSLHGWVLPTRTFRAMRIAVPGADQSEVTTGVDDEFAARGFENIGAWVMGRNMFGPMRGPWKDHSWKGWWGENPPYHTPVFILTHHARPSIEMEGGTLFTFVTDGIHSALKQAMAAAKGKDVRLGGGVSTVQQYLRARVVDEMHLAVSPVLLGRGEHLFSSLDLDSLGYKCVESVRSESATHVIVRKV